MWKESPVSVLLNTERLEYVIRVCVDPVCLISQQQDVETLVRLTQPCLLFQQEVQGHFAWSVCGITDANWFSLTINHNL